MGQTTELGDAVGGALAALRRRRPLVHAITNPVAMALTANGLLACGAAAPVMASDPAETGPMAAIAAAVLVNLGTLQTAATAGMRTAAETARARLRPVVLDPVAVGVSTVRRALAEQLLDLGLVALIKGNADEILALAGDTSEPHGAAGTEAADPAAGVEAARALARRYGIVVVRTGPVDHVTDGRRAFQVHNGSPLLVRTAGTGCLAGALIAAFLTVQPDHPLGAACALAVLGAAAERAARSAAGPGSFVPALLDALAALAPEEAAREARIHPTSP